MNPYSPLNIRYILKTVCSRTRCSFGNDRASDWYYVYTDQIFSPEEKVIHFKTNTANDDEDDVILKADLFNPVSDLSYTRPEKLKRRKLSICNVEEMEAMWEVM